MQFQAHPQSLVHPGQGNFHPDGRSYPAAAAYQWFAAVPAGSRSPARSGTVWLLSSTWVGSLALFIFEVIAATITVGLCRFPVSFCITRTGRTPPCSDPTDRPKIRIIDIAPSDYHIFSHSDFKNTLPLSRPHLKYFQNASNVYRWNGVSLTPGRR